MNRHRGNTWRRLLLLAVGWSSILPAASQSLGFNVLELVSPNEEILGMFGASVAGVDDVNGDGYRDLVVGAYRESPGDSPAEAGCVYVYSGADGALLYELVSPNEEFGGAFGFSLAGVGDVDRDGHGDFAVGVMWEDPADSPLEAGRVYLFSGAAGTLLYTLVSPNEGYKGQFGFALTAVGDIDGDEQVDLLVGARGESYDNLAYAGRIYTFSGATGALLYAVKSPRAEHEGGFGLSVDALDGIDGDAYIDLAVGAFWESPAGGVHRAGHVYLLSSASGEPIHVLASPNEETEGMFGISVASVGDIDRDGHGDLLVGAPREDPGSSPLDAGRAYLFSGASGRLLNTFVSSSESYKGEFGRQVAGIEDMDGDGEEDFLIGAPGEGPDSNAPYAGRAYLFSGRDRRLLHVLVSPNEEVSGAFGRGVFRVGDIDRDGRGDFAVSAPGDNSGMSPQDAGRVYVFLTNREAVEAESGFDLPSHPALAPNHPNPFFATTTVTFDLPAAVHVRLSIYDVLGHRLARLLDASMPAGTHEVHWEAGALPGGVYLYRIEAGGYHAVRRMVLVR